MLVDLGMGIDEVNWVLNDSYLFVVRYKVGYEEKLEIYCIGENLRIPECRRVEGEMAELETKGVKRNTFVMGAVMKKSKNLNKNSILQNIFGGTDGNFTTDLTSTK